MRVYAKAHTLNIADYMYIYMFLACIGPTCGSPLDPTPSKLLAWLPLGFSTSVLPDSANDLLSSLQC